MFRRIRLTEVGKAPQVCRVLMQQWLIVKQEFRSLGGRGQRNQEGTVVDSSSLPARDQGLPPCVASVLLTSSEFMLGPAVLGARGGF